MAAEKMERIAREELARLFFEELRSTGGVTDTDPADALIKDSIRERASDIHLDPQSDGVMIRFRIDGMVVDAGLVSHQAGSRVINQFKTLAKIGPVATFMPREDRFTYQLEGQELDMRASLGPGVVGEKMTLRLLDTAQLQQSIYELGLGEHKLETVESWLDHMHGMLLATGPTGSGKTTTLYALLNRLRQMERSIVTLEDPVEYQVDGVTQMQVDEEHGLTYAAGIKAMLRLDPDYLLVGEIRDPSSARAATNIASTGHVMLSTMHSHDPVGALSRLRNWDLEDSQIAAALSMVINQRLVRRLCTDCRKREAPTDNERRWMQANQISEPEAIYHAVGCDSCRGMGYRGRIGVFEIWKLNEEDLDMIVDHTDAYHLRDQLRNRGHIVMLTNAMQKVEDGVTTLRELWKNGITELSELRQRTAMEV